MSAAGAGNLLRTHVAGVPMNLLDAVKTGVAGQPALRRLRDAEVD